MMKILFGCLILAGCREAEPPRPSADEAAQLDEAEKLLNDAAGNEEGPEAEAPDPSVNR